MAQVANPRKGFNFRINLINSNGIILNNFLVQEVKLPETSVDVVEHGDTNHLIKTGGLKKYGNLTIKKICPADFTAGLDNFLWSWINGIQNENVGGGELPIVYKRICRVEELAPNGVLILNTYTYEGVWPNKINGVDLSRIQSNNKIEEAEFCVDKLIRI